MPALNKISFEFSPPPNNSHEELQKLERAVKELTSEFDPAFITLTFHPKTKERRDAFPRHLEILQKTWHKTVAHLTYNSIPRSELLALADTLWNQGIRTILALRGDIITEATNPKDHFQQTDHFVTALRAKHDFEIIVTAYPKKHMETDISQQDIDALYAKQMAGANMALTQFFFDNDRYYRLLIRAKENGITIPIIPGLLPIKDPEKTTNFAKNNDVYMPPSISKAFREANKEDYLQISQQILAKQIKGLIENGVEHIHFYTRNDPSIVKGALRQAL
jgi:methylenetetrahydrofolate reductase (NADPH)